MLEIVENILIFFGLCFIFKSICHKESKIIYRPELKDNLPEGRPPIKL